jgi:hypothetical protein
LERSRSWQQSTLQDRYQSSWTSVIGSPSVEVRRFVRIANGQVGGLDELLCNGERRLSPRQGLECLIVLTATQLQGALRTNTKGSHKDRCGGLEIRESPDRVGELAQRVGVLAKNPLDGGPAHRSLMAREPPELRNPGTAEPRNRGTVQRCEAA